MDDATARDIFQKIVDRVQAIPPEIDDAIDPADAGATKVTRSAAKIAALILASTTALNLGTVSTHDIAEFAVSVADRVALAKYSATPTARFDGSFWDRVEGVNYQSQCTLDATQIVYVAFDGTNGSAGAWVRRDVVIRPSHAGAKGDGTDDTAALTALNSWFFNDGTVFHDRILDLTGWYGQSGNLTFGPSAASLINRRWMLQGQLTLKQLQAGVAESVRVKNINYTVSPLSIRLIGYGADSTSGMAFATLDTFVGINFYNCAYSQFGEIYARGHYFAGINIIGNSPVYAEGLRLASVIGLCNGSGYTGANASLTSTWTAGAQSGTAGSTAQSQVINVPTLPKELLDTAGPSGTFPGAVRVRINGYPYLVTAIDRGTNNVTIYPWLDPAAGAAGTLTWCFGGIVNIAGNDVEGFQIDKLYGILNGAGLAAPAAYGPIVIAADLENNGSGIILGSSPSNVCYGYNLQSVYCEANTEDLIFIGHWGTFQHGYIDSSYTITTSKVFQIGDPRWADGSFAYAGGTLGLYGQGGVTMPILGRLHRYYGPNNGSQAWSTSATFLDHGDRPTIRPQYVNSQTITLGSIDGKLHEFFGYKGANWEYIGTGTNGAPTGNFTIVPRTATYANCTTTNGSAVVTMPSTAGLFAGMPFAATGVPANATILSVDSATQITLSAAATASATVTATVTGSVNGAFTNQVFSAPWAGPVEFAIFHTDFYALKWQVRVMSGLLTSATAGIGYSTGAGGTGVQPTSRATAVTLNKLSGKISLFSTTTTAGQVDNFTFNNSQLGATDTITFTQLGGSGMYILVPTNNGNGTATVKVYTPVAVAAAEAPSFQFNIIKGVQA